MRRAIHFEKALGWAMLVHAGTLFAFGRLAHRADTAPGAAEAAPIEVHLEEPSPRPQAPEPESLASLARAREPGPRPDLGVARSEAETRAQGKASDTGGVPAPSLPRADVAPDASGRPWTFSPTTPSSAGSVWLGLRATPDAPSSLPGGRAGHGGEDDGPSNGTAGVVDSVRAALDAHDTELGLGAGGPLVDPTKDAVRASLVPDFARAVLEFTTDRTGLVVSVRVLDSNAERSAWDEVAEKLSVETRRKPLRLPAGSRGVAVTMQVESKSIDASGQDTRTGVLSRLAGGLYDPTEVLMNSTNKPRRIVVAKVVSERRL